MALLAFGVVLAASMARAGLAGPGGGCTLEAAATIIQLSAQSESQMMGYIIRTGADRMIVIDGGTTADAPQLAAHIRAAGGVVTAWFLSHPHHDHVNALLSVADDPGIRIERIFGSLLSVDDVWQYEPTRAAVVEDYNAFIDRHRSIYTELQIGDRFRFDELTFTVLGIRNPEFTQNYVNNSSCVLKMESRKTSVLFLGDLGLPGGEKLLQTQNRSLKSDIVQMAHHGQGGVGRAVYQAIAPRVCLWPTPDWLLRLESEQDAFNSMPYDIRGTISWVEELNAVSFFSFTGEVLLPLEPVDRLLYRIWPKRQNAGQ